MSTEPNDTTAEAKLVDEIARMIEEGADAFIADESTFEAAATKIIAAVRLDLADRLRKEAGAA